MKCENTIHLSNGKELKIYLEHEGGFINDIKLEGPNFIQPEGAQKELEESLKWVQLNSVALYTRIRFFMLKKKIVMQGIDCNQLAVAICKCN